MGVLWSNECDGSVTRDDPCAYVGRNPLLAKHVPPDKKYYAEKIHWDPCFSCSASDWNEVVLIGKSSLSKVVAVSSCRPLSIQLGKPTLMCVGHYPALYGTRLVIALKVQVCEEICNGRSMMYRQ
jgi:hypothetical protein